MRQLLAWKASKHRKPLLLEGPRQVGKTWLLQEFGRQAYGNVAYMDFEATPSLTEIFDGDFDAPRIINQLQLATGTRIVPGDTLIVFDEVQACPAALTSLKYFNERANEYHIACAGSLLGVALQKDSSFPVGKVNFIPVNPLSFDEFLADRQPALADALKTRDWTLLAPFHNRLVGALRDYLFVGGMPEVVARFAENGDYAEARLVQQDILNAYDRDFSKHAPPDEVPRIRAVWASIPRQLAKPQARFTYGELGPGARGRTHGAAIEWLQQAGVVMRVAQVSVPRLPLAGYVETTMFKLYLADVGLLGALGQLDPSVIINGNQAFTELRGAMTEQYAAMQLLDAFARVPNYWANDGGTAEVDFVVQRKQDIVPVEVKANRNLKAKSLAVYNEKYAPALSVRASLAPYASHGTLVDLPLYALSALPDLTVDLAVSP